MDINLQTENRYIDNANGSFYSVQGIDQLYLLHFSGLYRYAFTIVNDTVIAEEMVQQVFFKILEKRESLSIHSSLKGYLYRSVNNECFNYLKHLKVRARSQADADPMIHVAFDTPVTKLQMKELESNIRQCINQLPEQCRTIFQLSRFENLKYAEIAEQLGLSVKTVETQMSRALKKLRSKLSDYLVLLFWLWIKYF